VNDFGFSKYRIMELFVTHRTLSQNQITSLCGVSERNVKYILKDLAAKKFIRECFVLGDMRRKTYRINST
jgi:DNA-binding MarR family transcriptional regulator